MNLAMCGIHVYLIQLVVDPINYFPSHKPLKIMKTCKVSNFIEENDQRYDRENQRIRVNNERVVRDLTVPD